MWYCPPIYSDAISATFLGESVFHQLHTQPLTHHLNTYNNLTKLLPQYKLALKEWGRIPTAYILPKAKKQYAKGRPIVSFTGAMMRALTHDLADIIYLMLRQACPQALSHGDTHQQLRALHTAFHTISTATADETISRTIHNQDLSRFFTSISTERFLNSSHLMTHWYRG